LASQRQGQVFAYPRRCTGDEGRFLGHPAANLEFLCGSIDLWDEVLK
jgi:hypothetical protein